MQSGACMFWGSPLFCTERYGTSNYTKFTNKQIGGKTKSILRKYYWAKQVSNTKNTKFYSSRCWPANTQKFVPGQNFNYEEASNLGLKSDCSSKARYQTRANSLGKKRRSLFFKRGLKFMKTGVARRVVPQTRANFFLAPQHFRTYRCLALAA